MHSSVQIKYNQEQKQSKIYPNVWQENPILLYFMPSSAKVKLWNNKMCVV